MRQLGIAMLALATAVAVPAQAQGPKPPHPKPGKCDAHAVGYNASGTLVGQSLTQTAGAGTTQRSDDRYSGTVTVNVLKANHGAPTGTQSFTLDNDRAKFADANHDRTADTPKAGDRVQIHGKITQQAKKCDATGFTPTIDVRDVRFRPATAGAVSGPNPLEDRVLLAVLTGRNEIGADGRKGAGDSDGRGSFSALVDGNQLCFAIAVKNLDQPVGAHIHQGRQNQNGAIVVPLTQPSGGDPGASSGCVTVDPALAQAILAHPRDYYANVHTTAFPGGAVRGQLSGKSH